MSLKTFMTTPICDARFVVSSKFLQYIALHVQKLPQHLHIRGTALIYFILFLLCFHIPYNFRQVDINKDFEQVRMLSASAF